MSTALHTHHALHILLSYFPSKESALQSTYTLLDESLIVCANLAPPVESFYLWKGKRCTDTEYPLWMKTTVDKLEHAKQRIQSLHPYEIPAILDWSVNATPTYLKWAINKHG